jgi:hypothetical protein
VTDEVDSSSEETGGMSLDVLGAEHRKNRETLSDQGIDQQVDRTAGGR